jgi:hypothetical protein
MGRARASHQALAVPATPANAVDGPAGFDPSRGETRLLVCGGRDFTDTVAAYKVLDAWHRALGIGVIIEGDARGADRIE